MKKSFLFQFDAFCQFESVNSAEALVKASEGLTNMIFCEFASFNNIPDSGIGRSFHHLTVDNSSGYHQTLEEVSIISYLHVISYCKNCTVYQNCGIVYEEIFS